MTAKSEEKKLYLYFHGRILQHLGIQMYQRPTNAIAELVANTWDADAKLVEIHIPKSKYPKENFLISIADNGNGMTFDECQDWYLKVGRNQRVELQTEKSPIIKRPLLGRKGIGKFAGFGIAKIITVDTTSGRDGEHTVFSMNLDDLLGEEYISKKAKLITVVNYEKPSKSRLKNKGTKVILSDLTITKGISVNIFRTSLARKFLLPQLHDDFKVKVNGVELPDGFPSGLEYCFPRDYTYDEKYPELKNIDHQGWGEEELPSGKKVYWRIGFSEDTIKEEELRGISIFTRDKCSQEPCVFNITGGLVTQYGIEYMTGQVRADHLDEGEIDDIATERQRIDWKSERGQELQEWGQSKIRSLSAIWKKRRAVAHAQYILNKIDKFRPRLDKLEKHERKTIENALKKVAQIETLTKEQLQNLGDSMLTAWETGRLHELIVEISEKADITAESFITLLAEADVLTALNIAEAIKTKLTTIGELQQRIKERQLENKLRDFIYEKPWLIHPDWERFQKERSVKHIIEEAGAEHWSDDVFKGRVDLVLSSSSSLMIIEFMRPGLDINIDHIDRFNNYVLSIDTALAAETGIPFKHVEIGYLIADNVRKSAMIERKIKELEPHKRYVMGWKTLLKQSLAKWEEFLDIIKKRTPDDPRLKDL